MNVIVEYIKTVIAKFGLTPVAVVKFMIMMALAIVAVNFGEDMVRDAVKDYCTATAPAPSSPQPVAYFQL